MSGASPENALVPVSEEYGDVYFSRQDGLAETRHVFLNGNDLPARWQGQSDFTIAELGFGTGLNFMATAALWKETVEPEAKLTYIGFEKHPLDQKAVKTALEPFQDRLDQEQLKIYHNAYPGVFESITELEITSGVRLVLVSGDVNETLPTQNFRASSWYLDGFKPATNPEMWSQTVFKEMARLSRPGASFATFTAAGLVKRGLMQQGFAVQKVKGYGRKRDMLIGTLEAQ